MPKKSLEFKIDDRNLQELINAVDEEIKDRIIHDQVEYGIYVELGTVKMPARPALIPAYEKETKNLPQVIGQAIEKKVSLDKVLEKVARDIEAGWKQEITAKNAIDTGAYRDSVIVTEA